MDPTMTDADARATLRSHLLDYAPDCTPALADEMLEAILTEWGGRDFARLARLIASVQIKPGAVLHWMATTLALDATPNGRELVFFAGYRAAAHFGMTSALKGLRDLPRRSTRRPPTTH